MNEYLRRILFLPPQGSTIASDLDSLHYFVILTTMAGATLVTLIGGYFLLRYRLRGPEADRPNVDAAKAPHFLWEIGAIAGLVGLFLTWWFIGVKQFMRLRVAPEHAMDIYVTAKKWMWKFAYPEGARSIGVLYVPVGRPVRLVMTSRDVIHSFFVPSFRVKQDALPGRYTTLWFEAISPGTYEILCTEYCGTGHSTMRGEVVALSAEDYARWIRGGTPDDPRLSAPRYEAPAMGRPDAAFPRQQLSLVRVGERIAGEQGCLRCHSLDGTPHIGPTWAGLYQALVPVDGREIVADEAYLTESIMDPAARIHRGFQAVMPSYLGKLDAPEIAAIVELIRSLRDVRPEPGALTPIEAQRPGAEEQGLQGRGARQAPPRPAPPGGAGGSGR